MPLTLGTESNAIERRSRFFCAPQSGGGVTAYPVGSTPTDSAGGPLRTLAGSTFDFAQTRESHGQTKTGARDFVGETYSAMKDIPWTVKTRAIPPPNLAGTSMPEIHHLLRRVCGARTISAGTQIQYAPADITIADPITLARLMNEDDPIIGEWLTDCIVNSWTLRWAGGSPPEHEFAGKAGAYAAAGRTTLNGAVSSSTTIIVSDADSIQVGARVEIGGDDNSGSGYLVTSRTNSTTFVVGTSLSASDGAVVRPFMPAPTYSDQPALGAVDGGVTLGGSQIPLQSFEFTVDNQVSFVEDEVGTDATSDGVPGDQMISGQLTLRATQSVIRQVIANQQFATAALVVSLGTGATNRNHVLSCPQIEMWVSPIQSGDVSTTQVSFKALDSADGAADAFTFTMS